jgi:maltooligosyltrehalose synthase
VGEDDAPGRAELAQLLQDLSQLSSRDASEPAARRVRLRGSVNLKRTLASLVALDSALAARAQACVQRLNGTVGEPHSFDLLDALIDKQAYRLANWRVASDDVNYRRFFDVNTLAAVRMERQPVFEATHKKLLQWLRDGRITALRIDHPMRNLGPSEDGVLDHLREVLLGQDEGLWETRRAARGFSRAGSSSPHRSWKGGGGYHLLPPRASGRMRCWARPPTTASAAKTCARASTCCPKT